MNIPSLPPYMRDSMISITMKRNLNYVELLKLHDPALLQTMNSINPQLLNTVVYEFQIKMQPEQLSWKLYKNNDEIRIFMGNIAVDLDETTKSQSIGFDNGSELLNKYNQLRNLVSNADFNDANLRSLVEFLNMLARHPFMKKSQQFLLFIEHCVPVDKWDMKIYRQLYVYRTPTLGNKLAGFFSSGEKQKIKDFFITVASDGILKSDNHLLQSRINFMIPFTNQLTIECKQSPENFITYIIQACAHEQLVLNFFNDYTSAINFVVALNMALDQSSYSSMNHRFKSYSPIRNNCASKLYVDGQDYYSDLYDCLAAARWQVCITGWMITPYFLLKRPNSIDNKQYRLDGILQSLAERGVKIYIICFMQPKIAVNNDSEHVQVYLQSLHDNIKVYRHPNDAIPILWSHHEKMCIIDQEIGFMGGLDICYGRWDNPTHNLKDPGYLWDGADYCNARIRDVYKPRQYKTSNLNPDFQPRMPWHDIALQFRGDIVLDLLRHFVQYWYFVKAQLYVDPKKILGFLHRRYEQAFNATMNSTEKQQANYLLSQVQKRQQVLTLGQKLKYMFNGREQRFPQLLIQTRAGKIVGGERLQMCRSASQWSIGVRNGQHQASIHNAYIQLIEHSQKFIYIENQFFMGLENKVVQCLAKRIQRAYREGQKFRVIIVMPLLPGFEGDIKDPTSSVLRVQVHYEYQAILRGENSLFKRLHMIPDISRYVYFYGLRQSDIISGTPRTEIIYVHSKLMIVDDVRAIIGSANINDRSLLGTRDSQLACIIEENQGNIANLRCRIFQEHFGLTQQETLNIMEDNVWDGIIRAAKEATLFYRTMFGCIPDDLVTCGQQVEKLAAKANFTNYSQEKVKLKGHAVEFPLLFMKDEDLRIRPNTKQYVMPESMFS